MNTTESKTKSIKDRLQNGYPDACKELNREPMTLEQFKAFYKDEKQANYYFSHHKITTVVEALKEGYEFDWNNDEEWKHYPWWDMETYGDAPAGSGFSLVAVYCVNTLASVGARLSSKSEADAKFIAELMKDDYKVIMKQ